MYNNCRKCAKCGRTRAEDMSVTYHRFPMPGTSNITKARVWAKYCWPNSNWTSLEFLQTLYKTNKVLCGRHFNESQFYDNQRQKLSRHAVPDAAEIEELLNEIENIFNKVEKECTTTEQMTRQPLSQIENISTSKLGKFSASSFPTTSTSTENKQIEKECTTTEQMTRQPLSHIENISTSRPDKFSASSFPTTSTSTENKQNITQNMSTPELLSTVERQAQSDKTKKRNKGILKAINIAKVSEMTPREVKLYKLCQIKVRQIRRLKGKLKNKKGSMIRAITEDENVQQLSDLKMTSSFAILLQSQLKNCPKKPKGRRYTIQQKIMALVIYKKSPSCYRLLRRMFTLPCQSSLNKLLNRVPLRPGINEHIFTSLKKMAQKQTDQENIAILSFDEMSIRKHFHYDTREDEIQGFQDHGNHGRKNVIATKAIVFMLCGIRKKWKQPVAFYFSHILNADRLTVILKEILTQCFNCRINVVATVCDLSAVNIKVLKTLGATTREPYFVHGDKEVVALLDPPHLLKCTRNLLMKHNVECATSSQYKGTAKWSHIELFYNLDKNNANFVYAPALTEHHLHPNVKEQMRVKLAAQVFSHSVTAGILAKIASNELPSEAHATAVFLQNFDQLFDAVNADSPDLRRGKKYSTNLTSRSPHPLIFNEMKIFISSMKYLGSKTTPPSQDGWLQTINAIERLWKNLQLLGVKSLSTRRLNQDALENSFGCIRYNCGSSNNPTINQFVAGIKTAIISNLRHAGQKKNCEDDCGTLSNNLSTFLTPKIVDQNFVEVTEFDRDTDMLLADAAEAVEQATQEAQACGYVCGFIFKTLRHNDCPDCRIAFLSENHEAVHIFTNFREYDTRESLNYVTKDVIACVEVMATIINSYLNENAWKPQLKLNIMKVLDRVDVTFLNNCETHFKDNKTHIKTSTFYICIKRHVVLKNRELEEEEKRKTLERKMKIIRNK